MRGRQRCGPEYGAVVPREEGLARDERPPPLTGVGPLPPMPGLTPSLSDARTASEVQTPMEGGAPSGEIRGKTAIDEPEVIVNKPEVPPTEPDRPPPNTSPF